MATEMKLITDITLELTGETKRYEVVAKQGDKATRFIRITLKNNGQDFEIPAGMKVIANIQKPDRKCCYNTCSYSGSTVTMELTNQALAVAGTAECDIEIRDANDEVVLSSQAFTIEIEKSMRDENAIRSSNEFTQLEQDVREYAAEYLEKNPVQPTPVDKTLTKENEAADAKITGDAIKNNSKKIESLSEEKVSISQGKDNAGKILGIDTYGKVNFIDIGNDIKNLHQTDDWTNLNFLYSSKSALLVKSTNNRICCKEMQRLIRNDVMVNIQPGYKYRVLFFEEIKEIKKNGVYTAITGDYDDVTTWHEDNRVLSAPGGANYFAVCISKTDETTLSVSECTNVSVIQTDDTKEESDITKIFETEYQGKKVSILGDSISTYSGYIPSGNRSRYPLGDVATVNDTWWMNVIARLGLDIGVNNSWAGSLVSWDGTTETADIGNGKSLASTERIQSLGSNGNPDIILIFGGANDIGREVELGDLLTPDYSSDIESLPINTFSAAYMTMIIRTQKIYPAAKIICISPCFSDYDSYPEYTAENLNNYVSVIEKICDICGVSLIDCRELGINMANINDNTSDGLHPNKNGMKLIADRVIKAIIYS